MTKEETLTNQHSWNAHRYDAWVSAYGLPKDEASRIVKNPAHVLRRLAPHLGDIKGKHICNVQGSHGRVAVALATQGATVEVLDFSEKNQRYALELASAANVQIKYTLTDILQANAPSRDHSFDILVLELGILHYHQNLDQFFAVMRKLAKDGGALLLNEFHPIQRKLFWADGPQNYFHNDLHIADVPSPDGFNKDLGTCTYRFWTLGEVISSAINAGFKIQKLEEHPDWKNPSIPGSFTLVAQAV